MILRASYIQELSKFIDKPFVKILTGIRRCGKSTVLKLLKEELIAQGIKQDNILYVNFESFSFSEFCHSFL